MDDPPRNLKDMLSEAKDASELMVDLAYAALFFSGERMADEVLRLEERLSSLVHEMRAVAVLAARSPHDADAMSGVLHLISAIERIGDAAVDIARIVTRRLGIPPELVADLAAADEISHRVRAREDSDLAGSTLAQVELPTELGLRVMAIRREDRWIIDPDGDEAILPEDVLLLRGNAEGITELRRAAGAPDWRPPALEEDPAIDDLDRAVDVLVEMKNTSEVAVALAYYALLNDDEAMAAEVSRIEERLDEMREQLELWVLRAAADTVDPAGLRGLLHLGAAAAAIGDAAEQIVWLVQEDEEMHPILKVALGNTDEVIVRMSINPGAPLDGARVGGRMHLGRDSGFHLLAIRRAGRLSRPRQAATLQAGDEIIAIGPYEGQDDLASACGHVAVTDDDTGVVEIVNV
jgi:uncharacterized protein with PhoU and TrkA domain